MRLTVVVDNMCEKSSLLSEWGYAVHLETPHGDILMDTGGPCHVLLHNMDRLGISYDHIKHIVLSHGHYDHVDGLIDAVNKAPHAELWGGRSIARERRGDADAKRFNGGGPLLDIPSMHKVDIEANILPGVTAFIVPQSERDPAFQVNSRLWELTSDGKIIHDTFSDDLSLLVEGEQGISLLLGCAHSGLPNILTFVRSHFGIKTLHAIIGGTHLSAFSQEQLEVCIEKFKEFSVRQWRPNHCTGFTAAAALSRAFPDVRWAGAGFSMVL